jgi:hypothetical protein
VYLIGALLGGLQKPDADGVAPSDLSRSGSAG